MEIILVIKGGHLKDTILQKSISIIKKWEKTDTASTIVILGPPQSGKTDYMEQLKKFCLREKQYRVIPLNLDLKRAPIDTQVELYKFIVETLHDELTKHSIELNFTEEYDRLDLSFDLLIEKVLEVTSTERYYVTLFIDHIDTISYEFAEKLVSDLRDFNDKAAIEDKYLRLGLCIAGIKSLNDLCSNFKSPNSFYDVIEFPIQDEDIQKEVIQEKIKKSQIPESQVNQHTLQTLMNLTGGESIFLDPLLEHIGNREITTDSLKSATEYIYRNQFSVFKHIALRVWSDSLLQNIIKELQNDVRVPPKGISPDIDRFQLSGSVVLSSPKSSETYKRHYKFRNSIVKNYLVQLIDILDDNLSIDHNLAGYNLISQLKSIEKEFEKSTTLQEFFIYVEKALEKMIDIDIDTQDFRLQCFSADWKDSGFWNIQTKPLLEIKKVNIAKTSLENKIWEIVEDWKSKFNKWNTERHTFFHWTDKSATFTYAFESFESLLFGLSITVPRNKVHTDFTEFTLGHWLRFIKRHSNQVTNLILKEIGKNTIRNRYVSQNDLEKIDNFELINGWVNNKGKALLYWSKENGKFFVDPEKFLQLQGNLRVQTIDKYNEEFHGIFKDENLSPSEIRGKLDEIVVDISDMLDNKIGNFEKLRKFQEKTSLCIESYFEDLNIPFEVIPFSENNPLPMGTVIAISRRLRFKGSSKLNFHPPFHIELNRRQATNKPLKVLIVANDNDGELKEVNKEVGTIMKMLKSADIDMHLSPNETIEDIETILSNNEFQILHFCGHAKYHSDESKSGLRIKSRKDDTDIISYGRFAQAVKDSGLFLIYLSCCHGAITIKGEPKIAQIYLNCMEALVREGIPNVIGFRWAIEDKNAEKFAEKFYKELFKNNEVIDLSLAMLETRRTLWNQLQYPDVVASSVLISQTF